MKEPVLIWIFRRYRLFLASIDEMSERCYDRLNCDIRERKKERSKNKVMDGSFSPVSILVLAGFIVWEAVCYGFGAAIQSVNEGRLEEAAEQGNQKAARLLAIIKEPGRLIHTTQITTHLIGMVTGAVIFPVLLGQLMRHMSLFEGGGGAWYGDPLWWERAAAAVLAAILLLILIISFGIIIPKRLAEKEPEKWCYHMLPAVLASTVLFWPLTAVITCLSGLILKIFGLELARNDDNVTEEDIMSMVNEGHEQGVLEADETEMITNIFQMGDKTASDIMIHRTNMAALEGSLTLDEAVDFILNEGVNTRYPVYGEDIDDIIGILHLRDAAAFWEREENRNTVIRELPGLLRKASFIPETRKIDTLFKEMQSKKIHMEIVVDEYGQTAGLLTMEDILEEIVGNILDEYDEEEEFITAREDGSYLMSGLAPLEDVEEVLELQFPQEDRDTYDTLNGYLVACLDRIPKKDEQPETVYGGYCFKVLRSGSKMIESVLVTRIQEEENQELKDDTADS